jgi:hypothetical protein
MGLGRTRPVNDDLQRRLFYKVAMVSDVLRTVVTETRQRYTSLPASQKRS